jgi:hypothetical protein
MAPDPTSEHVENRGYGQAKKCNVERFKMRRSRPGITQARNEKRFDPTQQIRGFRQKRIWQCPKSEFTGVIECRLTAGVSQLRRDNV